MNIRTRFAPSPTGFLHIGNARAALVNWLFAKKNKGQFVFRIDDTDSKRSEERFEKAIFEDLAWLSLTHDMFFKQSERFDRYHEVIQELIKIGRLYPCYETPEELEFKRKRQISRGEPPIYDREALKLTKIQEESYKKQGRKPHWRFKMEPGIIRWNDLIRGSVSYNAENLGDPVLIREDGAYLYTLTSVVDDLDFSITHILRGEDHVSNTAVQIQLFEAISRKPISIDFAHTTLLLDSQGHTLSKRIESLSLGDMRKKGIEPMAVNSLLSKLGTSLPVEPCSDIQQLIDRFDLSCFSRTPPRLDERELEHLTHKLFQTMSFEDIRENLNKKGFACNEKLWNLIKGNIQTLDDIHHWILVCNGETKSVIDSDSNEIIKASLDLIPKEPWTVHTWQSWTQSIQQKTNVKGRFLFMPIRKALTGRERGPEMKDLILIMGYERVKNCLERALKV